MFQDQWEAKIEGIILREDTPDAYYDVLQDHVCAVPPDYEMLVVRLDEVEKVQQIPMTKKIRELVQMIAGKEDREAFVTRVRAKQP